MSRSRPVASVRNPISKNFVIHLTAEFSSKMVECALCAPRSSLNFISGFIPLRHRHLQAPGGSPAAAVRLHGRVQHSQDGDRDAHGRQETHAGEAISPRNSGKILVMDPGGTRARKASCPNKFTCPARAQLILARWC